jgi:hypothetical protein
MSLLDASLLAAAAPLALPATPCCYECAKELACSARAVQTDDFGASRTCSWLPSHHEASLTGETVRHLVATIARGHLDRENVLSSVDERLGRPAASTSNAGATKRNQEDPESGASDSVVDTPDTAWPRPPLQASLHKISHRGN